MRSKELTIGTVTALPDALQAAYERDRQTPLRSDPWKEQRFDTDQ